MIGPSGARMLQPTWALASLVAMALHLPGCRLSSPRVDGRDTAAGLSTDAAGAGGGPVPGTLPAEGMTLNHEDCGTQAREVEHLLALTSFAKDQAGAFHTVFEESRQALTVCSSSESLWYAFARSAELGFGDYPFKSADVSIADATAVADLALAAQPRSQRIAVIGARLHGDLVNARAALAMNPDYAPARLAVAQTLFDRNELSEALALCGSASVAGADTLCARIFLAQGNASKAASLARRDSSASWDTAPEPYALQSVRCAARETFGLALLAQHSRAARAELQAAAACGSTRAQQSLQALPEQPKPHARPRSAGERPGARPPSSR